MEMQTTMVARCENCPLKNRPCVPGYGPAKADIVIVGEAPGKEEVKEGVPFVGRSGALLDAILFEQGINPDEIYFTNVLLCHPEGNKTPTTSQAKACRSRLIEEIKSRSPNKVIAVGAIAAKTLLQSKDGIKHLRLNPQYSEELNAEIIPTYHPAAALRDPDKAPSIRKDIERGLGVQIGWEPGEYTVGGEFPYSKVTALDIEATDTGEILCIAISPEPGKAVAYPRGGIPEELVISLARAPTSWVMHNGKYDIQRLWQFTPVAEVDEDTMLLHYVGDERKGTHALEQVGSEFLGAPAYKSDLEWTVEAYEANREAYHQRCLIDADLTHRLYNPLHERAKKDGVLGPYETLLIPGANALAQVESVGVKLDTEWLERVGGELLRDISRGEQWLSQWVDNPRSGPQVKALLHEMGYKVKNVQAETLKEIDEPFTKGLLKYRKAHKMYTTYVKGWQELVRADGKIHSSFNLHVAETGRLSSSDPNLQNVPVDHPIRQSFVADDSDSVLLEMDYSQIELRIVAALSEDPWLLEVFREGRQIHEEVAKALFGPNYSGRDYINAKSVNFGTLYGETEYHLARRLGIEIWEAQEMIDTFFNRSPALLDYRAEIEDDLLTQGYTVSHFGRKRRFPMIEAAQEMGLDLRPFFKEAYNFKVQSPASDVTLTALIRLVGMGIVPRITIHDELVFSVPKAEVTDYRQTIEQVMLEANPFDVPIPVEAKVSYRWALKE
jgi:uracil-DNA glycosylase family 4